MSTAGWSIGASDAKIANPPGTSDVAIDANADVNITAGHIRMVSKNNTFELENQIGYSRIISYIMGTPTRTTTIIGGGDTQDLVPFAVATPINQTQNIAEFRKNGASVFSIDSLGRPKLGGTTALELITSPLGNLVLVATTPDGVKHYVAFTDTPIP
jgi:hypothetical protein